MGEPEDHTWPDRFPWGGVLALALVLAADAWVFGVGGIWSRVEPRVQPRYPMERGVVSDRLEFERHDEEGGDGPLVAVVGSSRAGAGLHMHHLKRAAPGIETLALGHAGNHPFEIRGLVDEILPREPALVVILFSEFDSHRPLRLMPQTAPGSLGAVLDLARVVGPAFVWEHRTEFLQVTLASLLRGYRFREMMSVAGLADYRRFARPGAARAQGPGQIPFLLEGDDPTPIDRKRWLDDLAEIYPELPLNKRASGLTQCNSITRGPHATAQLQLIRDTVDEIVGAGSRVLLVEGPLAPVSYRLYDTTIREEFLETARALAARDGVDFLPLEEAGDYPQELFVDLTHLQRDGAKRYSTAVGRRIAEILRLGGS